MNDTFILKFMANIPVTIVSPIKCFTVDNTKGPGMDALNDIQEDAVLKVNAEEKPWRKPGRSLCACRWRWFFQCICIITIL